MWVNVKHFFPLYFKISLQDTLPFKGEIITMYCGTDNICRSKMYNKITQSHKWEEMEVCCGNVLI